MADKPLCSVRSKRVQEIYKLLMAGKTRPYILEHCSKVYDLKRASADSLMQDASKMIEEDIAKTRGSRLGVLLNRLNDIYEKTTQLDNYPVARQVIMDEAKLLGLDNHAKTHIIDDKRELSETNDDELETIAGVGEEG